MHFDWQYACNGAVAFVKFSNMLGRPDQIDENFIKKLFCYVCIIHENKYGFILQTKILLCLFVQNR